MKNFLIFLAAIAACRGAPDDDFNSLLQSRIIGGVNAVGIVPYQVSLQTASNNHFCGGSIISSRSILTAAHCIVNRTPSSIFIAVGSNTLGDGKRYAIFKLISNPDYNPTISSNDIGLIITKFNILMSPRVAPIALEPLLVGGDVKLTLTGWGLTTYPATTVPKTLQVITLSSITNPACKSDLSKVGPIFDTQICTKSPPGRGACKGDSGGPLIKKGSPSSLVGIVSWGSPCAKGLPDVFTRVSSFIPWIKKNMV